MDMADTPGEDTAIAIIGMAGRFPGAPDIAALRAMLLARRCGIRVLAPGEDPTGQDGQAGYVPARGVLDGAELFDAALFGIAPRDAALMDPQQRIFLECCWAALEDAGHAPQGPACATAGIFASASMATHWLGSAAAAAGLAGLGGIAAVDKDMLAGRVAYHLGLGGPAVGVQTACSSSLVGIHLAVQALIAGECDLALAGGVSVTVPLRAGYIHQPGGVMSPDGACRPYTTQGGGTVKGDGAGVVVLRRLADALAEGETIRAVILGSAVTNDGRRRAGFAAPGLDGQARAIREALQVAGLAPGAIGFVEGHGTATQVGDAIELQALAQTFGPVGPGMEPPVLGAAKAHLGHLDAAAGVTGLIKAVLALEEGVIPPALHAGPPHPDLAASGFVLADAARPWPRRDGPRRAGVSAFGLGGTNAHVVIGQAPTALPAAPRPGPHQLVLSARSRDGLAALMAATRDLLLERPGTDLADLAHTLARGRLPLPWRVAVTASTAAQAIAALALPPPEAPAGTPWPDPPPGRRIPLPTTPFERVRHWLDAPGAEAMPATDRLLAAGWRSLPPPPPAPPAPWLVIAAGRRGAALADQVRRSGVEARLVETPADIAALAATGFRPAHVLHATALAEPPPGGFLAAQMQGAAGLPGWVQALAQAGWLPGATLLVAASHATSLGGEKRLRPEHAGLLAAPATLMAEHPGLRAAFVDLGDTDDAAACLLAEALAPEPVIAWRHGRRWVRDWQALPAVPPAPLRAQGVWLVTGGTGGVGLLVAEHLARRTQARLLLAGRDTTRPALAEAIGRIAAAGGQAEAIAVDLEAPGAAAGLVARALDRFGALHGVVHAAGRGEGGMVQRLAPDAVLAHLAVKPAAALGLAAALAGRPLDRFVLCGSHAGAFGAFGQYGYAVANAALAGVAEALAAGGLHGAVAVHWDRWQGTGMALAGEARHRGMTGADLPGGLAPEDALALFDRVLGAPPGLAGLLATSRPVAALVAERRGGTATPAPAAPAARQPRPAGLPAPVPPATPTETVLVALWEAELGFAPIGTADAFVTLGGDSLNALRVAGAAQARHGIALPLPLLMEDGTIARIAARLDGADAPAAPPQDPVFTEDSL